MVEEAFVSAALDEGGCGGRKCGVEEEVLVSAALDEMVVEGGRVDSRKVRHAATWIQRSCIQVAGFAL